ncbi:bifunctional Bet3 family/NO signaling-Golgi transport ligand-binding domain superfamily/Transport protein particle (TRAPP) component [Babesia duncani]|uniref:Trafficking protein particle complex subunit n=1 Tax=Babesia duncani TaxID=323732 RepID=A0AAD9PMZ3_9APIC|nr:bifunctional Bet3 family/NO signaling-Golgi transport ligand-binding domain superfamily/Transport protein particle (TRAPP) component [Babesia duncani]
MATNNYAKMGAATFAKMEKINSELLSLTYGSLVCQLIKDIEFTEGVNAQLITMGRNIGLKLVDELISKLGCVPCTDFASTVEVIAKIGLKVFLGISGDTVAIDAEQNHYHIIFHENPLDQFVYIPEHLSDLNYSNLICGVIMGALEQLQMKVSCHFVKDMLKKDDVYEISIKLEEVIKETFSDDE